MPEPSGPAWRAEAQRHAEDMWRFLHEVGVSDVVREPNREPLFTWTPPSFDLAEWATTDEAEWPDLPDESDGTIYFRHPDGRVETMPSPQRGQIGTPRPWWDHPVVIPLALGVVSFIVTLLVLR